MSISITRGPPKPSSALGSAHVTWASEPQEASTPPVVGCIRQAMYATPASRSRPTAAASLAICISAGAPSCMRVPPDAGSASTGSRRSVARSNARATRSPVATPMLPPRKPNSPAITTSGRPWTWTRPVRTASPSPVRSRASASRSA